MSEEKIIEKAKSYLIIVEGKKDKLALEELGFRNIFVLNHSGKSILESIEQIEMLAGKTKICILTDFDKKGRKLYLLVKSELSQKRVHLDNSLRNLFLKKGVFYIEDVKNH